jgi:hypothetical protein
MKIYNLFVLGISNYYLLIRDWVFSSNLYELVVNKISREQYPSCQHKLYAHYRSIPLQVVGLGPAASTTSLLVSLAAIVQFACKWFWRFAKLSYLLQPDIVCECRIKCDRMRYCIVCCVYQKKQKVKKELPRSWCEFHCAAGSWLVCSPVWSKQETTGSHCRWGER